VKASCPRAFEAEALRDGRLTGAEKASYERHLGSCAVCAREARSLEALARALRAAPAPGATSDELHVRRERTRLLAAFDRAVVRPEPRLRFRNALLAAAALAVTVAALLGAGAWLAREPQPDLRASRDAAVVVAAHGATWSRRSEGNLETVVLTQGELSIRVDSKKSGVRLRVVLPDGELEDIGTTFSVSVEALRTARVRVDEGRVVLRLRGRPPLSLGAGQLWTPDEAPSAASSSGPSAANAQPLPWPSVSSASAAPPARSPAVASALGAARPRGLSSAPVPPPSAPPAAHTEPDSSSAFRAAMAALDSGDHDTAAARFARFVSAHPGDARAEDAAYLRILALQRAGRTAAMKQAALDYLRRHPKGFRRAEAEALSR